MSVVRGRPPGLAGGMNGSSSRYWASLSAWPDPKSPTRTRSAAVHILASPRRTPGTPSPQPIRPRQADPRTLSKRAVRLDPAGRAGAPDHEVGEGGGEVAGPSLVGPGDGLIEGDQHLGLLAGEEAVREDGALQAAQVAEADPVAFQGFGDEGTKRGAQGLTLLCRMGFTGSVSGMGGGVEGEPQGCHERLKRLKGLRLWKPGFDGFLEPAEEVWRIPHGPDGGNGNRSRTLSAVAFKP